MKRYSTALLFGLLSLTSQLAHADIVDDAIGNIQQAINDAYNPSSSRSNDDDDRYDRSRQIDSRQLEDRRRRLDERQRQLDDDRRRLEEDERRLEDDYDRG